MVIIVHRDPDGDDKLRDWGRERGLTVLPLFAGAGIPEADQLEAALCSGLYSHDPFDLAGPVRAAHQFFGRAEVPDLARRLKAGHIQALFGIRKIGKTSVLNRVLDECRRFHGMACAFGDCSDDGLSSLTAGGLLNSINGALNDAICHEPTHYTTVTALEQEVEPHEAAQTTLRIVGDSASPVLLILDEVDYITPSSPVSPSWQTEFNKFFRALRLIYQECCRREIPFSIVLSGVSSRWFQVASVGGIENSALAFVPEGYLPPFERTQSLQMLQTLGRTAGLVFDSASAEVLAAACSDIPFWIRKVGSFVHSCYPTSDRPVKVSRQVAADLAQEFIEVEGAQLAFSSLQHLFSIFPELGDAASAAAARLKIDHIPQPLLSALGRYGLVDDEARPSGPMVGAGLEMWKERADTPTHSEELTSPASPAEAVAAGSLSSAGEEEWAALLSEVSHRRNVLERDLRDFVPAIVRSELAARTDGRTPASVMLAAVPGNRRDELGGLGSKALLKALYWSELIGVITRNFSWFQPYFGDRPEMALQAAIINDRPDAHAKDMDGAELALQRRAIGWFEDRIAASGVL
jgi:hypothetical protein